MARTLEVGALRRAFTIILPAAAPTILTGMRISIGIAWLVIVAAEMLVGGTGIGYFVWNEWNNFSITNVIIAILVIGLVGMVLDQILRASPAGHVSGSETHVGPFHLDRGYREAVSGAGRQRHDDIRGPVARHARAASSPA